MSSDRLAPGHSNQLRSASMEHAALALVVITLLQPCRAEISDIVPRTWFSANAINDGYSPKPISEIFSTEPTPAFSPTKPIVVLPSFSSSYQTDPEVTNLSTNTHDFYQSSTPFPSSTGYSTTNSQYDQPSTQYPSSSSSLPPSSSSFPTDSSSYTPTSYQSISTFGPHSSTNSMTTPSPFSDFFDFTKTSRTPSQPPQYTSQGTTQREGKNTQSITFEVPQTRPTLAPQLYLPQTQTTAPPNYFVIYQNVPQLQPYHFGQQQPLEGTQSSFPMTSPLTSSTPLPPSTTLSDGTLAPFFTNSLTGVTSRPTITFRSTPPSSSTRSPMLALNVNSTKVPFGGTSPPSPNIHPGPPKVPFMPHLKIRVVAPKGSITNVKINPSTTPRPPPTRRTKKPKKNTYDACLNSCKGRKDPLCAIPLASVIVDSNKLKGFNSICHMACHNSYKPDPYEKLVNGRCGRLRTRIIRVDGNTKIHREDLKKAEYSVINTGPRAIVEFAHGNHPK